MSFELQSYLKKRRKLVDDGLQKYLPAASGHPSQIHQAVSYSVFSGGKRLRPILLLAGYELFRDDIQRAVPFACAVEMLHTYSLIHDDLPAMDDDDFRRGKPTTHKAFGEATAILAGDALQTEAFGLLARAGLESGFAPGIVLQVILELAEGAGLSGMVAGQAADMAIQGRPCSEQELELIHRQKTSALIRASVRMGARLAEADESLLQALSLFGERVGLAFQIADDILDAEGGKISGKAAGSDQQKAKATYVALFGLKNSKQRAEALIAEALQAIKDSGPRAEPLRALARFIINRES